MQNYAKLSIKKLVLHLFSHTMFIAQRLHLFLISLNMKSKQFLVNSQNKSVMQVFLFHVIILTSFSFQAKNTTVPKWTFGLQASFCTLQSAALFPSTVRRCANFENASCEESTASRSTCRQTAKICSRSSSFSTPPEELPSRQEK